MLAAAAAWQTGRKELLRPSELMEVSFFYWGAAAVTQQFLPLYRVDKLKWRKGKIWWRQKSTKKKKKRKRAMKNKLSPAPKFMPIWISSSMCQWRVNVTVMIMLCLCNCHHSVPLNPSNERSPGRLTGWRPSGQQHCKIYVGKTAGEFT